MATSSKYTLAKSKTEKYLAPPKRSRMFEILGIGKRWSTVFSFNFRKSTTTRQRLLSSELASFGTTKSGEFYGDEDGTMIPRFFLALENAGIITR